MLGAKSALDLFTADSVILNHQQYLTIDLFQCNPDLLRMSMANRIGDALLNYTVNCIFFILIKFQMFFLGLK